MPKQTPRTRLQMERLKLHLTQEELAEKVDCEVKTLGRWERGEQIPKYDTQTTLSDFFGEKVDDSWFELIVTPHMYWQVPYGKCPYFTDNEQRIEQLHTLLTVKGNSGRVAISGLGGIGKTLLAIQYAYAYGDDYTSVFWLRAGSLEQFQQELASLGRLFLAPEIPKQEPTQQELINEALHWFQTHKEWLLILDNVEEEVLEEKELRALLRLLILTHGHIVLTTRTQSIANLYQNFLLHELTLEEAAQLLLHRSRLLPDSSLFSESSPIQREDALALAHLLGALPLAVEQASAYIRETGYGLAGYRHLYETSRKELLQRKGKIDRIYTEYSESVATTWLVSFRRIEQQSSLASDLLNLCAYLAPDAIPTAMIIKGAEKLRGPLQTIAGDLFQFNDVCQILLNYSLLNRFAEGTLLSVHRLVQAVIEDSMDHEKRLFWVEQTIHVVEQAFSSTSDQAREQYIPHGQQCATHIQKHAVKGEKAAHLLKMVANAIDASGFYAQARPFYEQAFQAYKGHFGMQHHATWNLLFDVLHVTSDMGESVEAAEAYLLVEPFLKKSLKPAEMLSFLLRSIWFQAAAKDIEQTERIAGEAQSLMQTIPKLDPMLRAQAYQAIAGHLSSLSEDEVVAYYTEALQVFRAASDHLEVAETLINFGFFCADRLDVEKGKALLSEALTILEKHLAPDHPEVADVLVILAMIAKRQKLYQEAEAAYLRAYTIRQQKLGQDSPETLQVLRHLAALARTQEKSEEAEHYFSQALAMTLLPGENASTEYALLLQEYTAFLYSQGRVNEAQSYKQRLEALLSEEE